jgi:hypothetical protein
VMRDLVVDYGTDQTVKRMLVNDARGKSLWDESPNRVVERPYRRKIRLPLGTFTFVVELEGGGRTQVEFAMTSLEANQPAVVVKTH